MRCPAEMPDVDPVEVMNDVLKTCARYHVKASQIEFPRICVVGAQSAGKSLLLIRLIGEAILPVKNTFCTRCPAVLQLCPLRADEEANGLYVVFQPDNHCGESSRLTSVDEIREEFERRTNARCGADEVSEDAIIVEVHSPRVPKHLTLVDLPGIQMVSEKSVLQQRILKLVKKQIESPEVIILAVSAASDVTNSVALSVAKEADPEKQRTIGVLTKVDQVNAGDVLSHVVDVVQGRAEYKVDLGVYAMRSPTTEELQRGMPADGGLAEEQRFFRENAAFATILGSCGLDALRKKLRGEQLKKIRECSKRKIVEVMAQQSEYKRRERALRRNGNGRMVKPEDAVWQLCADLHVLAKELHNRVHGVNSTCDMVRLTRSVNTAHQEVSGDRLHRLFSEELATSLDALCCEALEDRKIEEGCNAVRGVSDSFELCFRVAKVFISENVVQMRKAILLCGEKAVSVLRDDIRVIVEQDQHFSLYPNVRKYINQYVNECIERYGEALADALEAAVKMESMFINASSPSLSFLKDFTDLRRRVLERSRKDAADAGMKKPLTVMELGKFVSTLPDTAVEDLISNVVSLVPRLCGESESEEEALGQSMLLEVAAMVPELFRVNLPATREHVVGRLLNSVAELRQSECDGKVAEGAMESLDKLSNAPDDDEDGLSASKSNCVLQPNRTNTLKGVRKTEERHLVSVVKDIVAYATFRSKVTFLELVPKTIMLTLVDAVCEGVYADLTAGAEERLKTMLIEKNNLYASGEPVQMELDEVAAASAALEEVLVSLREL